MAPFRKLRQEKSEQGKGKITDFIKYDIRQMHTAFTGTIPFSREEEDVLVSLAFRSPPLFFYIVKGVIYRFPSERGAVHIMNAV